MYQLVTIPLVVQMLEVTVTHSGQFHKNHQLILNFYLFYFSYHRKRPRKKAALMAKSSGVDLESSGEFASVEKMLATTDTNKFRPFLQGGAELVATKRGEEEERRGCAGEWGQRFEVKL